MSNQRKREHQIDLLPDNYQQHLSILQVQILQLKLKKEKLRDRLVYQSIKDKISTH